MKYLIEHRKKGDGGPWDNWGFDLEFEDVDSYLSEKFKSNPDLEFRARALGDPIYPVKPLTVGDSVRLKKSNGVDGSGEIIAITGNIAIVFRHQESYSYNSLVNKLVYCAKLEELELND